MLHFESYSPTSIRKAGEAPDATGIYLWLAKFDIGDADWRAKNAGSEAAARENLWTALSEQCAKFGKQEINVNAIANFKTLWQGNLYEDVSSRFSKLLLNSFDPEGKARFDRILSSDDNRQLLISLLAQTFPTFSGPLYVGTATKQTLRERLNQHSLRFLELWELAATDQDAAVNLAEPTNFAERAFKMGFSPEDLYFSCLAVRTAPGTTVAPNDLEDAILATEWLLNRWTTPMLGRA
jgi:hypothetical protein